MKAYDYVVVGAGLYGAVFAREAVKKGKKVLVIGGAGTIGSSYIRALLPFRPAKLVVVDLSENGLTELTRDLRSTFGMYVPPDYRTYPLSFADPIRPTSMSAARRMSIPYRRCWKTMC